MKKTLLASAVTLATLTTGTFAVADTTPQIDSASELAQRLDSMPQVYGNIQLAWAYTDADDIGSGTTGLVDNGSTLGVTHEHELSPGLEAFMKIELEGIKADDKDNRDDRAGLTELDEAYIGLKGGFGQVWVGSDDSAYERLIDGIAQYYEYAEFNPGVEYTTGEGDLVQYSSPSFSGLTVHAAIELDNSFEDEDGVETGGDYPYQLGVQYAVDQFSLAVAMDSNDQATGGGNSYGIRGAFQLNDLELSALYSTREDSTDAYGLMAIYSMGANTFAASYEFIESDNGDQEASVFTLQALHSLSDNMYVYTEAYLVSDDGEFLSDDGDDGTNLDSDITQLVLGAVYAF